MRKSQFTEKQITGMLGEAEAGAEAQAICRRVVQGHPVRRT